MQLSEKNTTSDCISRQAAIDFVGSMEMCDEISAEAYKKLTNYFEDMPSAQPMTTKGSDLINRDDAIWAVYKRIKQLGMENNADVLSIRQSIRDLPSAQPELIAQGAYVRGFEQGRTQGMLDAKLEPTCNQLATDTISRQAAIDALDGNVIVDYIRGCADRMRSLPSAQPEEDCDTCKHGYFGDTCCNNCKVRFPSHYERRSDETTI